MRHSDYTGAARRDRPVTEPRHRQRPTMADLQAELDAMVGDGTLSTVQRPDGEVGYRLVAGPGGLPRVEPPNVVSATANRATRTRYRGYVGRPGEPDRVTVEDPAGSRPLPHIVRHSPDGFAWGYSGSGPEDLALSLLADATGDIGLATALHHDFAHDVIAGLARSEGWTLTAERVTGWARTRACALDLHPPMPGPDVGLGLEP